MSVRDDPRSRVIVQMTALLSLWILAAGVIAAPPPAAQLTRYEAAERHMGVDFEIVLYAPDEPTADHAFRSAFVRIEQLDGILSDYDSASELSRLNRTAPSDVPVKVSDDLWTVLSRAQQLSRQTEGAFDVTAGPLTKLWRRARRQKVLPAADKLAEAFHAVGHMHLRLDAQQRTVQLLRPQMRLDLGGIGKGYAADAALAGLRGRGIARAMVDGSGDLAIGDPPPGERGWKIGIARLDADAVPDRILRLANVGVATSGDAWQYVEIDGRRYSHIVDPRTGLGLTGRSSVTIVAPDCITADSLASAASVLGPQAGLRLVEETCGAAALILYARDGKLNACQSRCFQQLPTAGN